MLSRAFFIGQVARAEPLARSLRRYAADERGAVATDWAFMTAATCGCGIAVVTTLSAGTEELSVGFVERLTGSDITFSSQHFGRSRLEVLLDEGMEDLSTNQATNRYNRFTDPSERTDAQVRNAHRTWSRRAADPTYSNPERARDMVRILEMALELRAIEPHTNI